MQLWPHFSTNTGMANWSRFINKCWSTFINIIAQWRYRPTHSTHTQRDEHTEVFLKWYIYIYIFHVPKMHQIGQDFWSAISRDLPVSTSPVLGFQVFITIPGSFMWILEDQAWALMPARQALYWLSYLPRPHSIDNSELDSVCFHCSISFSRDHIPISPPD